MNLDLRCKTAVVGGGSQGLGFASGKELALLGANVILVSRNEAKLEKAVAALPADGNQKHDWLRADFQDPATVRSAIENFLSAGRIAEILINNTGGPPPGELSEVSEQDFINAFQSHLLCNQVLSQSLIPGMKKAGFGRIVNIISTSVRQPIPGLAVSNTIRGAVASWSKTLSREVAQFGITVNNVLPGFTRTSRYESLVESRAASLGKSGDDVERSFLAEIPLGRIAEPEEFGAAVAFLCSPAAGYITGVSLPVDGGKITSI